VFAGTRLLAAVPASPTVASVPDPVRSIVLKVLPANSHELQMVAQCQSMMLAGHAELGVVPVLCVLPPFATYNGNEVQAAVMPRLPTAEEFVQRGAADTRATVALAHVCVIAALLLKVAATS
jgi:hypothetical protein